MASRSIAVQMERPHDFYFDPVYTVSSFAAAGAGAASIPTHVLRLGAVSGANRYKYFRAPSVPTLRTVPPEVLLSVDTHAQQAVAPIEQAPEPLSKTVGTQSDYRDSEAQTDPFTPDYIAIDPNGPQPELQQLLKLTWGRGLPAGVAEVEMIERADEAELTRHFGSRLEFGTAGLRGPMGPGPNCMSDLTVLQAAQARIRLPASVDARSPRCYRCCRFLLMHHI